MNEFINIGGHNITRKFLLISSHRRSGTHLTIDSIINNFEGISNKIFVLETAFPYYQNHEKLTSLEKRIKSGKVMIIKSHITHELSPNYGKYGSISGHEKEVFMEISRKSPKIYVVRDGRDVMVSYFYYLKALYEYNVSFIDHLEKHLPYWIDHVTGWLKEKDVLLVTYESFAHDYQGTMFQINQFTKYPMKKKMRNVFGNVSRANLPFWKRIPKKMLIKLSIIPRSTAVLPRKGIIGDWKNYFNKESKKFFKLIAGDLLINLGYEESHDW
ncbi:MAG: sulfotransferase domain-containing protein [Candidatus Hermodarchaeota archaeon]